MGEAMIMFEEKKAIKAEETQKRRQERAERKQKAIEEGKDIPDEPDTEEEVPADFKAGVERLQAKEEAEAAKEMKMEEAAD